MEWRGAKNFVLVLLLVLNVGLGFLNYQRYQENILTFHQEKAIFDVLSKNGISLYTDLINKFPPMRRLSLEAPVLSRKDMTDLFFQGEEAFVTVEFGKTILKNNQKTLTIQGNSGVLELIPRVKMEETSSGGSESVKVAEEFMQSLEEKLGIFSFGNTTQTREGYLVTFFQEYKGQQIFPSNFQILVAQGSISRVEFSLYTPLGFTQEKKDISFSDEVLLTFMKEVEKTKSDSSDRITVTKMVLGYDFQEDTPKTSGSVMTLVPCYRIYTLGEKEPYLINGYTNEIIGR